MAAVYLYIKDSSAGYSLVDVEEESKRKVLNEGGEIGLNGWKWWIVEQEVQRVLSFHNFNSRYDDLTNKMGEKQKQKNIHWFVSALRRLY